MTEGNRFLKDVAFLPALWEDYGYYLIKKDVRPLVHEGSCPGLWEQLPLKKSLQNVVLGDKKLGVASMVDFLHWERNKYRVYIDTVRLSKECGSLDNLEELFPFLGRMALATLSKCGYADWVHCDYAIVGADRVCRATGKERRHDVQRIHKVQAILRGREYLDAKTSYGSLFPNLKAIYGGVFQLDTEEKKQYHKLCEEVCDVSVIWQCGLKRRRWLRENKIYRWDDPCFEEHFYGMVSSPLRIDIIRKMLSLSMKGDTDFCFPPKEDVLRKFPILSNELASWVFVDFETDYQKCIYLLGYYTAEEGYQCEWADHLDSSSEKPLMYKIYSILSSYKHRGFVLCYFVAERNFWRERCRFHHLDDCMDLFDGMLDLSHVFIYSPLIIRNVFNFKLKNIASKLYDMGYIGVKQPEGCMDGAESVDLAKDYFKTRDPDISIILERYNQFDCEVLYELVVFLQKYFYLD